MSAMRSGMGGIVRGLRPTSKRSITGKGIEAWKRGRFSVVLGHSVLVAVVVMSATWLVPNNVKAVDPTIFYATDFPSRGQWPEGWSEPSGVAWKSDFSVILLSNAASLWYYYCYPYSAVDCVGTDQVLRSPKIDVSGGTGAVTLRFTHSWQADFPLNSYSEGWVEGSSDGFQTTHSLMHLQHNNPAKSSGVQSFDLSSWAAGQTIQIQFRMVMLNDWFWNVDDFSLSDCPADDLDCDGVPDDVDLCPDQPGPAENDGCPVPNSPPIVSITGPPAGSVYPVGTIITLTGSFVDEIGDTHTAMWTFDGVLFPGTVTESGGSGTVTDTFSFAAAGVYPVTLTVTDDQGASGSADTVGGLNAFIVVYDPSEGFVTGGGWIDSPPGAYVPSPTLTGKATFGFVAKYQTGASTPTGQTEFQFQVADMNFHSTSYQWLVCGGPRCQFKGDGTINGVDGYSFLLTAVDGELPGGGREDKLRMKIWITLTGQIVYDNQGGDDDSAEPTTVIGGGSIVIHKG